MDTGQKLILGAASSVVLCIALYLLIFETRSISNMFDVVRDRIKEEELYQQYNEDNNKEVTYAELVAALMSNLEYDILVNGVLIKKENHDTDKIKSYRLDIGDYVKKYQYDESGNIYLIIYNSKG